MLADLMKHMIAANSLEADQNFQKDNPFPYHDKLADMPPSYFVFEFMKILMDKLLRHRVGQFIDQIDPAKQLIYPTLLKFDVYTHWTEQEDGRFEMNAKALNSLLDYAREKQRPVLAISSISSKKFNHLFTIIVLKNADGYSILTYDSLDYNKRQHDPAEFDEGSYSDYATSGTACVHEVIRRIGDSNLKHINLAKYCFKQKCIQYYLGSESCAMYVAFFVAFCVWKNMSSSNAESVLQEAVRNTYEFQRGTTGVVTDYDHLKFDASDMATKLMRTLYVIFVVNIVMCSLKIEYCFIVPEDEWKEFVIEKYETILRVNNFFADRYSFPLLIPKTLEIFCQKMPKAEAFQMLKGANDENLLETAMTKSNLPQKLSGGKRRTSRRKNGQKKSANSAFVARNATRKASAW